MTGNTWVHNQHCGYCCPGAKASGHQYPQCWLNVHYTGTISYKNITGIQVKIRKDNHILKKIASRSRVNTRPWSIFTVEWIWQSLLAWNLCGPSLPHYNDVIMGTIASPITSLTIVYSTFVQMQIKENIKAPRHWPLCGEFTGDRWIPRTNGQ